MSSPSERRMLWVSLPDQRARRELYWMSRMPGTRVRAMAKQEPVGQIDWIPSTYRRPSNASSRPAPSPGCVGWTSRTRGSTTG